MLTLVTVEHDGVSKQLTPIYASIKIDQDALNDMCSRSGRLLGNQVLLCWS